MGSGQWAVGVGILSGCFCIVTKCSSAWRWVALWWVVDGCPFSRHGCSAARKSKQPLTAFNWHSNPLFMCCSKWTGGSVVVWSDWAHLECHISHIHIYQYPGHISICSHISTFVGLFVWNWHRLYALCSVFRVTLLRHHMDMANGARAWPFVLAHSVQYSYGPVRFGLVEILCSHTFWALYCLSNFVQHRLARTTGRVIEYPLSVWCQE